MQRNDNEIISSDSIYSHLPKDRREIPLVSHNILTEATATFLHKAEISDRAKTDSVLIDYDPDKELFLVRGVRVFPVGENGAKCKWCGNTYAHHGKQPHDYAPVYSEWFEGREYCVDHDCSAFPRIRLEQFIPEVHQPSATTGTLWKMFGATDLTVCVIDFIFHGQFIFFASQLAEIKWQTLEATFLSGIQRATLSAKFKNLAELPDIPNFQRHPLLPPSDYQIAGMRFSQLGTGTGLLMEPGTGKTCVAINRVCYEAHEKTLQKKGMYRVLVICPQHLRLNWEEEFKKFATYPGKVGVLRGDDLKRMKCLNDAIRNEVDCEWTAGIISYDAAIGKTFEALAMIPWDLIVLDESHFIKNPRTDRFRQLVRFSREFNVRSRMILTGTAIANTVMDLWAQLEFCERGASGFISYEKFKAYHGKYVRLAGGVAPDKLVGVANIPLLQERLARYAFQITKEEAGLQLPPKTYDIYEIELTTTQRKIYEKLEATLAAEIEGMLDSAQTKVTADFVLTKLLRLAQITSGFVSLDEVLDDTGAVIKPKLITQIAGGNPKLDAIEDIFSSETDPNAKKIVWSCFVEDMRSISERLTQIGIPHVGYHAGIVAQYRVKSPHEAVERYNCDPAIRGILMNQMGASVGLNAVGYNTKNPEASETYTNQEVFYANNWNRPHRVQAEDRAHRRGTRGSVRITDLITPKMIDEEIRNRLLKKTADANLIGDVSEILSRVLNRSFNNAFLSPS